MAITHEQLTCLLEAEIAAVTDADLRSRIMATLVALTPMRCAWDYGFPGETFACWKAAADTATGVGIVHCDDGFGPERPWGLVWLKEPVPSMGQDSGWFSTFREAVADIFDIPPHLLNARQ